MFLLGSFYSWKLETSSVRVVRGSLDLKFRFTRFLTFPYAVVDRVLRYNEGRGSTVGREPDS